jgi:hypothetical protein
MEHRLTSIRTKNVKCYIKIILLVICYFVLTGCTKHVIPVKEVNQSACYIMFDAGSSGTRLFVYENQGEQWIEHSGPKISALANPIRQIRGKNLRDIDKVTTEVTSALDDIKHEGPIGKNGKPEWGAFDWSRQCITAASIVYATAGMRIAEQDNRENSIALWLKLREKLQRKLGNSVPVIARTITGYEEGLYTWLAIRWQQSQNNFGIVEMGGASTQVTFPCSKCDAADDAVKNIIVKGKPLVIYSYSFLGLGQDEVTKAFGLPPSCAYGVGANQANWKTSDCSNQIPLTHSLGINDPYNFENGQKGAYRKIPTKYADVKNWYITGAFNYMDNSKIDMCCRSKGQCFDEAVSCYRAVYLKKYLQALAIPETAEKLNVSWTLGAVICAANNCLQLAKKPVCRWSAQGCL